MQVNRITRALLVAAVLGSGLVGASGQANAYYYHYYHGGYYYGYHGYGHYGYGHHYHY